MPGSLNAMAAGAGFGRDQEAVNKLLEAMEAGELKAEDVFPGFAKELMVMANRGNALEQALNNTAAAVGRFRTNVWLANKTFNESGYDKAVKNFFNTSSDAIERAELFWIALGKAAEYVGLALEAPIELFGVLAERIPIITGFVSENSTAFKLLAAYLIAVVKPLRKLVMLTMILPLGLAAISDLIENWNRDRTWGEWVTQIGLAVAALAILAGALAKILGLGKAIKGVFGGKSTSPSVGGSSRSSAGTGGGGFGKFLKGAAVASSIGGLLDVNSDYRDKFSDGPPEVGLLDKIDSLFANWVESRNSQPLGQIPYSPEMLASMQNKKGTTQQFIGDVHISVESPDAELAGTRVGEEFQKWFGQELRMTSTSELVTEK